MKKLHFLLIISLAIIGLSSCSDNSNDGIETIDVKEHSVSFEIASYQQEIVPITNASRNASYGKNAADYFNRYSITLRHMEDQEYVKTVDAKELTFGGLKLKKGTYTAIFTASVEDSEKQIISTGFGAEMNNTPDFYIKSNFKGGLIPFKISSMEMTPPENSVEPHIYLSDAQYASVLFEVDDISDQITIKLQLRRAPLAQIEYVDVSGEFPIDHEYYLFSADYWDIALPGQLKMSKLTAHYNYYYVNHGETLKFWALCIGKQQTDLVVTQYDGASGIHPLRNIKLEEGKKTIVRHSYFKDVETGIDVIEYDTSIIDWDDNPIIEER